MLLAYLDGIRNAQVGNLAPTLQPVRISCAYMCCFFLVEFQLRNGKQNTSQVLRSFPRMERSHDRVCIIGELEADEADEE